MKKEFYKWFNSKAGLKVRAFLCVWPFDVPMFGAYKKGYVDGYRKAKRKPNP